MNLMWKEKDRINKIISDNAPMRLEDIIALEIKEFRESKQFAIMRKSKQYYLNNNDIIRKHRYNIVNGQKEINTNATNSIVPHPYLRDLIDQKTQYLLGNDWSIEDQELAKVLDDDFRALLQRTARDSILCGIGWMFPYPEEQSLKFKRIDPLEVIPIWEDNDHTKLNAVIHYYQVELYEAYTKKIIEYAEYWDISGMKRYRKDGNTLKLEEESTHFTDGKLGYNWNVVPFIPLKYNDDELCLLQLVKGMIDQYDISISETSDMLSDTTDKIKVLKGAQGTEVAEFSHNIKNHRAVAVPVDGDITEIGSSPDVTAAIAHQEQLRKNIYEFGRGVDVSQNVGANSSGEARRFLYAKLDLDCNQLESGVLGCLRQVIWFYNNSPINSMQIDPNVKINFSRNMMVNTAEIVDIAAKTQGISGVSQETIVGLLPFVENPKEEIKKANKEVQDAFINQANTLERMENTSFLESQNQNKEA